VTHKGEEEKGEGEEDEEEGKSTGGVPLPLEPMGNMGVPTYLKLLSGASQVSNFVMLCLM
jgi:hypothetical protein